MEAHWGPRVQDAHAAPAFQLHHGSVSQVGSSWNRGSTTDNPPPNISVLLPASDFFPRYQCDLWRCFLLDGVTLVFVLATVLAAQDVSAG